MFATKLLTTTLERMHVLYKDDDDGVDLQSHLYQQIANRKKDVAKGRVNVRTWVVITMTATLEVEDVRET